MNYIVLINTFWKINEIKAFSSVEIALYFYLLHLVNRSQWETWIDCADRQIMTGINISKNVLKTSRLRLKDSSLIEFVPGGKGYKVRTRYQLLTPKFSNSAPDTYLNKNKNNLSIKSNGKGFLHTGSDFDQFVISIDEK